MAEDRTINSWSDLELKDLFYAYRKAKVDCFYERTVFTAIKFARYEKDIGKNLNDLFKRLSESESVFFNEVCDEITDISVKIVAKKLGTKKKDEDKEGSGAHCYFSDTKRAFESLSKTHQIIPEFRMVGDFSVEVHVLSALWINLVGHKYDAVLSKSSYGSRLRRYRAEGCDSAETTGKYQLDAIGSFEPYWQPYRQWRSNGLDAIRTELEAGRKVVAISMDLSSYYHQIDPAVISNPAFREMAGIILSDWELAFTKRMESILVKWSNVVLGRMKNYDCVIPEVGGLPIGLSISRVLANALLVGFDKDIEVGLSPVYYGRYVDDMFLVLRDNGGFDSCDSVFEYFCVRFKYFIRYSDEENGGRLNFDEGEKTKLVLQKEKQKIFFLTGDSGLDFLRNIDSHIRSVSSERKLMPTPDGLEQMRSAQVLTAAESSSEECDTLRRADGLSIRRLGLALQLRWMETLACDLRPEDWKAERKKFYQFALDHILSSEKIFNHLDCLPRLVSLAVSLRDFDDACRLYDYSIKSIDCVLSIGRADRELKINGIYAKEVNESFVDFFKYFKYNIECDLHEVFCRSLPWDKDKKGFCKINERVAKKFGLEDGDIGSDGICLLLRECDLAKISYKDHIQRFAVRYGVSGDTDEGLDKVYVCGEVLKRFVEKITKKEDKNSLGFFRNIDDKDKGRYCIVPFLFPTRPFTPQEVALLLPNECVLSNDISNNPLENLAKYVHAIRGVWIKNENNDTKVDEDVIKVASKKLFSKPICLGITSFLTEEKSWSEAASGKPDLSPKRYKKIRDLINQVVKLNPKPTHLLLPELSIPERWIGTVSRLLQDSGISLIAGMDYHYGHSTEIHSDAVLVLEDDRLGYRSWIQIRQPKIFPAPGEEESLLRLFGRHWKEFENDNKKVIYDHGGFRFGLLVCSELQNINYRQHFQGEVDCVMVLSWNQDLETFSALVESAALDVHAYIALVNNRKYGDSRVRCPAKKDYERDVCRVRGGKNDQVVVVELEINKLREFQSRAKRWPQEDDAYKPVPEGFQIPDARKRLPQ